jgi:hypothetical protein
MMDERNSDIADVLQRIRTKLRARVEPAAPADTSGSQPPLIRATSMAALQGLLASARMAQRQVGTVNPRRPGIVNSLIQFFKTLMRRMLAWYTRSLIEFHLSLLRFLDETTTCLEHDQSRLADLEKKVEFLEREVAESRRRGRSDPERSPRSSEKVEKGEE